MMANPNFLKTLTLVLSIFLTTLSCFAGDNFGVSIDPISLISGIGIGQIDLKFGESITVSPVGIYGKTSGTNSRSKFNGYGARADYYFNNAFSVSSPYLGFGSYKIRITEEADVHNYTSVLDPNTNIVNITDNVKTYFGNRDISYNCSSLGWTRHRQNWNFYANFELSYCNFIFQKSRLYDSSGDTLDSLNNDSFGKHNLIYTIRAGFYF